MIVVGLAALLSTAAAHEAPADAPCTVAGATVAHEGSVWSLDGARFDLSEPEGLEAFAHTVAPCAGVATWRGFVDWRAMRTTTRTTGWTAAATVWTVYGPLALVPLTAVRAAAVVPERKRTFHEALQHDLQAGPSGVAPPAPLVALDLEALEVQRTKRQWQVPLAVGGGALALVGSAVVLLVVSPPELGGLSAG